MKKRRQKKSTRSWIKDHKAEVIAPFVGLVVTIIVFGIVNSQFISGKIAKSGGVVNSAEAAQQTEELKSGDAAASPSIRITKIGVEAPVLFDAESVNEADFQELLKSGTVHYPTTAAPGAIGNAVVFGHSSGRWWAPGDYKFVFSKLDQLENGDKIFIDYSGKRYMYEVTNQKIVLPTDLSVLAQDVDHQLTLLTCYPVGTNSKRLVINAKQVLPEPAKQSDATENENNPVVTPALPSSTPSLWDNLRDIF